MLRKDILKVHIKCREDTGLPWMVDVSFGELYYVFYISWNENNEDWSPMNIGDAVVPTVVIDTDCPKTSSHIEMEGYASNFGLLLAQMLRSFGLNPDDIQEFYFY